MILVLFGPPGSGKGTQAEFLKEKYGVVHFSTGAYLRELLSSGKSEDPLFERIAGIMKSGGLIPDEEITSLVLRHLEELDSKNPVKIILLDGYPRSRGQAGSLVDFCESKGKEFFVLDIRVDLAALKERLMSRVNCSSCNAPFSVASKETPVCPFCGSNEVFKRNDDNDEAVIGERIASYENISLEVLNFFDNKRVFIIDGNSDINTVKDRISKVVDVFIKEKF